MVCENEPDMRTRKFYDLYMVGDRGGLQDSFSCKRAGSLLWIGVFNGCVL